MRDRAVHLDHGDDRRARQRAQQRALLRREVRARGDEPARGGALLALPGQAEERGDLVLVGDGVSHADLDRLLAEVRPTVDDGAGALARDVATFGDRVEQLCVEAVEELAELLALRLAHRVAHQRLAGRLVVAARVDLGDDARLVERVLHVARVRGEPEGRELRRRTEEDLAAGAGDDDLLGAAAHRQVEDHLLASGTSAREQIAQRLRGGHARCEELDGDDDAAYARIGDHEVDHLPHVVERDRLLRAAFPEARLRDDVDDRTVERERHERPLGHHPGPPQRAQWVEEEIEEEPEQSEQRHGP